MFKKCIIVTEFTIFFNARVIFKLKKIEFVKFYKKFFFIRRYF